jgi:hypothetical protein
MPLKVSAIRLALGEPEEALPAKLAERLGGGPDAIGQWRNRRKSRDARRHGEHPFGDSAEGVGPDAEPFGDLGRQRVLGLAEAESDRGDFQGHGSLWISGAEGTGVAPSFHESGTPGRESTGCGSAGDDLGEPRRHRGTARSGVPIS